MKKIIFVLWIIFFVFSSFAKKNGDQDSDSNKNNNNMHGNYRNRNNNFKENRFIYDQKENDEKTDINIKFRKMRNKLEKFNKLLKENNKKLLDVGEYNSNSMKKDFLDMKSSFSDIIDDFYNFKKGLNKNQIEAIKTQITNIEKIKNTTEITFYDIQNNIEKENNYKVLLNCQRTLIKNFNNFDKQIRSIEWILTNE